MMDTFISSRRSVPHPSRYRVTDQRIYTILPAGTYEKLLECFRRELLVDPQSSMEGIPLSITAWCRFAFSLILLGGQAGPDSWREILALRFRHIVNAGAGYILLPRMGGEVPVYVPSLVSLSSLSLCRHLMRSQSTLGSFGRFPPDGYILPGRKEPSATVCGEEHKEWKNFFADWLSRLSTSCGMRVSVGQLEALSRAQLAEMYSPSIGGCLLGIQTFNPAPLTQSGVFQEYRETLDQRSIFSQSLPSTRSIPRRRRKKNHPPSGRSSLPLIASRDFDSHLARIRRIVCRYSRVDKNLARARRKIICEKLDKEACSLGKRIGKKEHESWRTYSDRTKNSLLRAPDTVDMNMAILVEWLSSLISTRLPNTVEGYLNDTARFLRLVPFQPIFSLSEATIAKTLDNIPIQSSSRMRLVNTLRMLFTFMQDEHDIPTPTVAWWRFNAPSKIRMQPLLSPSDLTRILAMIWKENRNRLSKVCAVLIGYYFGLRVSELCHLRMGDVWLDGLPTLFVWDSKGGFSRSVEIEDLPADILMILQEYYRQRKSTSEGNPSASFFIQENGKPCSRRQVVRFLGRAMDSAGIDLAVEGKRLVAHALRHACANRWWVLDVPLVEIARRLGHKSLFTTMQNYLHVAPFRQEEEMRKGPSCDGEVRSMWALAGILGLTTRGARYWVDRLELQGILPPMDYRMPGFSRFSIINIIRCIQAEIRQGVEEKPE